MVNSTTFPGKRSRIMPTLRPALVASCVLLLSSCGSPAPTQPGPPQSIVQGTWTGTVNDRVRGDGRLRLSVAGFEESARGNFSMTFADASHDLAGDVTISTIDRPRIELFFRVHGASGCPPAEGLVLHGRATLAAPDRISGNYADIVACGTPRSGTLELARP